MARLSILSKPRYGAKPLEAPIGPYTHGIFDSFEQVYVLKEHHTETQAVRAAARYNAAYENRLSA